MAEGAAETSTALRNWAFGLAALIVAGIAGAWIAGLFGPLVWKSIDLVRLGGEVLLLLVALKIFLSAPADRPKFPLLTIILLGQMPLAMNATNPVVLTGAVGTGLFALVLMVLSIIRDRKAGKESAA